MDGKIILVGHFGVRYEGARPNLVDGEIMHVMVHKDEGRKISDLKQCPKQCIHYYLVNIPYKWQPKRSWRQS